MEIGTLVNGARRVGMAEPRGGVERIGLSTRLLLPLLQQAGATPALTELARDLKDELATHGARPVALVLPLGGGAEAQAARIDLGGRQVAVPAALRDALLAQLAPRQPATAADSAPDFGVTLPTPASPAAAAHSAAPAGDAAARAWVVNAQAQAAALQAPGPSLQAAALVASGAAREVARSLAPVTAPVAGFARPLMDEGPLAPVTPTQPIAVRLQQQLERSGLFFESHLAQWTQGARSTDELRAELLQGYGGGAGGAPAEVPAQRVATQLAVLQHQSVALHGPAWPGQALQLAIEREPPPRDAPEGTPPVFTAHLKLDLPRLGPVQVRLRLAGDALATTLGGAGAAGLVDELPALIAALRARGLTPVATQVVAAAAE